MTKTAKNDGRRQRGDRARAQIVSHALAISSAEGLEGLSIGRIAREAGVGKGNIQVLFGDKEALQLATLEMAVQLYQREVISPALEQPSPLQRLLSLVNGWFHFVEQRTLPGGCFINAVSSEYRARPGLIRDRINHYREASRDRFRNLIREAIDSGELRSEVNISLMVFNLCAFQSIANIAALMDDIEEFDLARRTSLDLIYRHAA
ncbi:TetR/AcrR family transcriptional regulator [Serratia sp. Se-PFBMAAmG]|uniref:TetR/AcrR family transcriptional regulator n=1 Tax=Serratia sp. Se-RSBMAAmG TaxID=3043305 RepID=UPI0024AFC850|nr:TetR/AcrR family transcriptional regulator [Serratia sp. Se-RSBMAAmG]MDI6934629.1 TetR/AcrR family transcriptional regulator [Serratia sp. Se-PFBMAAmG]MDI6978402.1 TetR/AcrR family transcriptional regulator [Serratia sp. Se-RSBMAAmG]MDI9226895.1 TetR/AcrR family transcriptional regulator [Serratia bockelmannii]